MSSNFNLPISLTILVSLSAFISVTAKADFRGYSIVEKSKYDFFVCNSSNRCKRTKKVTSNVKMYISTDGKNIYDYASKASGDVIPLNGRKVAVDDGKSTLWAKSSRGKIHIFGRRGDFGLRSTYSKVGTNKCKIHHEAKWHQAGSYSKNTRTFITSCRIFKGNKFAQ